MYGCALARLLADSGDQVQVVEKRSNIGGNCFSYFDSNIEVHKYGSHIFHTDNEKVWKFVNKFTKFNCYQHHVVAMHSGKPYFMPFNLMMLNQFFGKSCNPEQAEKLIECKKLKISNPKNLEQQAMSLVGEELYNAFVKGYTQKQWNADPKDLDASIIKRLPIRYNYDISYFNDPYQGIPTDGYTKMMLNMLNSDNIHIELDYDYTLDDLKHDNDDPTVECVVFTGPLDRLFNYKHGTLKWRSLKFKTAYAECNDFQGNACVNYVDDDVPYTRIHEFKHYHPESKDASYGRTIIQYEYPADWKVGDDMYYPINNKETNEMQKSYLNELSNFKKAHAGGRLGDYKYYDMDDAIASAINMHMKLMFNTNDYL